MHCVPLLALLAAVAAASPTVSTQSNNATTSFFPIEVLQSCELATNCEVYDTPGGTMIRFVKGMEPGSAWYLKQPALQKRGKKDKTRITYGKNSINYGSKTAPGAIKTLRKSCGRSACDTTPVDLDTQTASDTNHYDHTLTVHAEGQYNGIKERDRFVDAIIAGAKHNQKCEDQDWMHGNFPGGSSEGTVHQCTQSTFISVSRFGDDNNMKGFVNVRVDTDDEEPNWCDVITKSLGTVASAIPNPAAGAAGSFFGTINAFCGGK